MSFFDSKRTNEYIAKKVEDENNKSINILLIDDEPKNLTVLSDLLGKKYRVFLADCGASGLKQMEQHHDIHLIIDQFYVLNVSQHLLQRLLEKKGRHAATQCQCAVLEAPCDSTENMRIVTVFNSSLNELTNLLFIVLKYSS